MLPDHLHTLWLMPPDDADFSMRWRVLKRLFSAGLQPAVRDDLERRRRERGIWQRRFWDHIVRDARDWRRHLDYIHYNPVKHGYCEAPCEWPYGSFNRMVQRGWYQHEWGRTPPPDLRSAKFPRGIEGPIPRRRSGMGPSVPTGSAEASPEPAEDGPET